MTCNVCGGVIPDGATICPVCGAPVSPAPGQFQDAMNTAQNAAAGATNGYSMAGGNAPVNNPFGAMEAPQGYAPGQQPMGMDDPFAAPPVSTQLQTPPQKSHTGLIIGIIAGVAVIAALVVCLIMGVFSGKNGKYYLDSMNYNGVTLTTDSIKAFGVDVSSMYLEINDDKFTLSLGDLGGMSASGDVSFDGSTITLTYEGKSVSGTISGKTITIEVEGSGMTFKK